MNFQILPEVFAPALAQAVKVAGGDGATRARKRASSLKPVYDFVLIQVTASLVTLRVEDPHVHFEAYVPPAEVEKEGYALVEADRLAAVLKTRLPGVPVTFRTEGEFLVLGQGEFRAQLPLLRDEMIAPVDLKGPFAFEMDFSASMLSAVNRSGQLIEEASTGFKPGDAFQGVLLDFTLPGELWISGFSQALLFTQRFLATHEGGFRAVLASRALPLVGTLSAVLPTRIAYDDVSARLILSNPSYAMRAACVEDTYPPKYHAFLGVHRLADGVYPVTKLSKAGEVESERPRIRLRFGRAMFLESLSAAACLLNKEDLSVELRVSEQLDDNRYLIELTGMNRISKAHAIEKLIGESDTPIQSALRVGIHYAKMREALKAMAGEFFDLHLGGKADPFILAEEGPPSFAAICVPLRTD